MFSWTMLDNTINNEKKKQSCLPNSQSIAPIFAPESKWLIDLTVIWKHFYIWYLLTFMWMANQ